MFSALNRTLCLLLITVLFFNIVPASALTAEASPDGYKHIYIENGVENVIITADKLNFKQDTAEFRKGRVEYGLLWTAIVAGMAIYFEMRR